MPKFKFGAEINFCDEYGLEPNFVLNFVPKLRFGADVTRAEHRSPRKIVSILKLSTYIGYVKLNKKMNNFS